jgi:hypothetical protein
MGDKSREETLMDRLDELRAENARLRADLEMERTNHGVHLKNLHDAKWDNRQLQAEHKKEADELRAEIKRLKRQLTRDPADFV